MRLPEGFLDSLQTGLSESDKREVERTIIHNLNRLATTYMRRERQNHTLEVDGLVNEAMLRVLDNVKLFNNKEHFYATLSKIMRNILVDHERKYRAAKRGDGYVRADITVDSFPEQTDVIDMLELNDLIEKLTLHNAVVAKVIDMKYFGGLTTNEIARATDLSTSTVKRYVDYGRSWLLLQIHGPLMEPSNQ